MSSFYLTCLLALWSSHQTIAGPTSATTAAQCGRLLNAAGATEKFNEHSAHVIHSMSLATLQKFDPSVTADNAVSKLNQLSQHHLANKGTPSTHFLTDGMRILDTILSNEDAKNGLHWTMLEKAVHAFHMEEMWAQILMAYDRLKTNAPNNKWITCQCVMDTEHNGINNALTQVQTILNGLGMSAPEEDKNCQLRESVLGWFNIYDQKSETSSVAAKNSCGATAWNHFIKNQPTGYANDAALFLYCALRNQ